MSGLDNLKKEAKLWLKALRAKRADARARLLRAWPAAPADPVLRHMQHALAREHGHESWAALKTATATALGATARPAAAGDVPAGLVATFLAYACWDHHTHGKGDHRMYDRAAQRFLAQHPGLARHSLYTAIVSGEIDEVRRILAARPEAAKEPGGSRGWTPILYSAFTRFTHPATLEHGVEIARLLLDHGANPNDFYMAGDSQYSTLVGVAGEGEQDSPRQPYAETFYQLLLERGAEPYDIQVLYDTHFSCDMIWWLELTYRHTLKLGRKADWDDPAWSMLGMGGYGPGAFFILNAAVQRNHLPLAEWALAHGADPNITTSSHPKFNPKHTVYDAAALQGLTDMADLLRRYGAAGSATALDPEQAFLSACMRGDRAAAEMLVGSHPELLRSHQTMFTAAKRDRPDVLALLLDLGVPLEVADEANSRALHHAAAANALRSAAFLIERGAEVDPRETNYGATPIGWASHGDRQEMLDFLSRYSRNVWTLAFRGYVDRLRDVLRDEPERAKLTDTEGGTPLWWLPDEEPKAMAVVELLLSAGADPSYKNRAGRTAADWARARGMVEIARRLGFETAGESPAPPPASDLAKYESLADDLLFAFESGRADSMQRLMEHFGGEVTWKDLRTIVRRRLENLGDERPEGYFGLPHARKLIAVQAGFDDWASLEAALSGRPAGGAARSIVMPPPEPADVPVEMRMAFPMRLHDGTMVATTTVWRMLTAARDGDLATVTALVDECRSLVFCDYNYMPPLHLAVREGHLDIVGFLAERGAVNRRHKTYPYQETILTVAEDRGFTAIAQILDDYLRRAADPDRPEDENGKIEYGRDPERRRFQQLVDANALGAVEALLDARPELATDPFAFWSEGVLMMPAHDGHVAMVELLLGRGARVPDMSKWGREYYFKRYDMAALLMERGMNPNHRNCHGTTLLHDMAQLGDIPRATLLLDRGADLDAVDAEFRSTPLGLAARWGHQPMVRFLLDRGADQQAAGADWATPLAWARKKGHAKIADLLRASS